MDASKKNNVTSRTVNVIHTIYLNESYSVPNMLDPEPILFKVGCSMLPDASYIRFADASDNAIQPIEIQSNTNPFLFAFSPNAVISKIYIVKEVGYYFIDTDAYLYDNIDGRGTPIGSPSVTTVGNEQCHYNIPSTAKYMYVRVWS